MSLLLRIENEDRLPDGGPMFVEVFGRGLDIGRDQHLDWTLPDSSRFISGKHCEIRFKNGAYVLTDVSTNGTFLDGQDHRVQSPYRLRHGDRLIIGHYVVSVTIRDEAAAEPDAAVAGVVAPRPADPWASAGPAADPISPRALMPRAPQPAHADPLDWIVDIPAPAQPFPPAAHPAPSPFARMPLNGSPFDRVSPMPDRTPFAAPAAPDPAFAPPVPPDSWHAPPPPPAPPPPEVAIPSPRRPAMAPPAPPVDPATDPFDWSAPPERPPAPPAAPPAGPVPPPAEADWSAVQPPAPRPPVVPIQPEPPGVPPMPPPHQPPPLPLPQQDGWAARQTDAEPPPAAAATPVVPAPVVAAPAVQQVVHAVDPGAQGLLDIVIRAAGIPPEVAARRRPEELAAEIGEALAVSTEELRRLLAARAEAKSAVRSSSHTMMRAHDNNPLKFTPSAEEAMRIMFGGPSRNYLGARAAIEEGFSDVRQHQAQTFAAMQSALELLFQDLSPEAIEAQTDQDKGFQLMGSRKARLWDVFVERWRTLTRRSDGRLVDAFTKLFAECYDGLTNGRR